MPPKQSPQAARAAAREAEAEYRRKFKSVLVRFTQAEMQVLDGALADEESAAAFLKEHGLKAAKRLGARK